MKLRNPGWTIAAVFAVPALGLAGLLLDPTGFPFWRGGAYSDLLISHWPIAAFIRYSIPTWHQLPLWNPLILSGMPLAADPLSGIWYLPNALTWVSQTGLGFNLLFWLHIGFAAWGVMALLRSEGATAVAGLLGGIAFAATPKLIGHIGLGHLTLVEAVCWTPWILLAIRRAIEGALDPAGRLGRYGLAGALAGLVMLIDPRWVIPACLLGIAYAGKCFAHSQPRGGRISVGRALVTAATGLGVAAPSLLPLLELMPQTTRSALTAEAAEQMSLPPARLLGAFVFHAGEAPESQTYLGATVILLLAVGAAASVRRGRFWTGTLLVSLLLAFGSFTPLYGWLMRLVPGLGSLRVPARFYLIVALAAAMLVGHGFDHLRDLVAGSPAARRVRLTAVGAVALMFALALAGLLLRVRSSGAADVGPGLAAMAGAILACAAAVCVLTITRRGGAPRRAGLALIGLVAMDLAVANSLTLRIEPAEAALSKDTCQLVDGSTGYGTRRLFSPSYSIPQQAGPLCTFELADGVGPLQLTDYRDFMASATGFSTAAYSVTLPPFADGDVGRDWHPIIDAVALGMLNVEQITSAYPLDSPALELRAQVEGKWLYRNRQARPRAWVEPTGAGSGEWRPVEALDWTPNRIRVRVDGPGRLVLSEIAYPGWQASVDGAPASIERFAGILRSVEVGEGAHAVEFDFVPTSVWMGAAIGALALLALIALKVARR